MFDQLIICVTCSRVSLFVVIIDLYINEHLCLILRGNLHLDDLALINGLPEGEVLFITAGAAVGLEMQGEGNRQSSAITLGIRHIAFVVENIEVVVAKLKMKGMEILSEIRNYENMHKLCYVRGLKGTIIELAEQLK
jgi:hypothetical protein